MPGGIPNIGQHRHKCYRSWNLGALTPAAWVRIAICLIGLFFFLDAVVVLAMSCDEFSDIDLPFDTTNKGTQQNSRYKSKVKMAEKNSLVHYVPCTIHSRNVLHEGKVNETIKKG